MLLKQDGILLDEVCDDRRYPLANNPSLCLSADRLEYTVSSGLRFYRIWNLKTIQEIYRHMVVFKNELGQPEIKFDNTMVAKKYVFKH